MTRNLSRPTEGTTLMREKVEDKAPSRQRVLAEIHPTMDRADLRKPDSADAMKEIGECVDFARRSVGWSLKQLAASVSRDERQVQRWIDGKENTNIAAANRSTSSSRRHGC
jgi:ribosome-binding protein aMBF1 (putative translation factor)